MYARETGNVCLEKSETWGKMKVNIFKHKILFICLDSDILDIQEWKVERN